MADEAPVTGEPPAPTPQPTPPPAKGGGSAGESALLEKITRLEGDLHKERGKIKTLETERDTFRKSATDYEVKDKKRTALDAALGSIGDDFVIDNTRRTKLQNAVNNLGDGPELEATIAELVDGFKQPKTVESLASPFTRPAGSTGAEGGVPEKKAAEYTTEELAVISRQEPERYKEIRQQRSSTLTFGAQKG
jgi:hypothetical protein